jgi:3D (Asp-Asp-Asp) domain-containing protein
VVGKTIAVDPSVIPLGSKVLVNGVEKTATDTGAKVKGRHVDLFVASRHEAISFGRREVEVEVER